MNVFLATLTQKHISVVQYIIRFKRVSKLAVDDSTITLVVFSHSSSFIVLCVTQPYRSALEIFFVKFYSANNNCVHTVSEVLIKYSNIYVKVSMPFPSLVYQNNVNISFTLCILCKLRYYYHEKISLVILSAAYIKLTVNIEK